MAGDLITSDYQMQLGTLLLGMGTAYEVDGNTGLAGWDDLPALDTSDVPRPAAPGDYPGTIYPAGRIITCQLSVHGDGPGHAANLAALRAATTATMFAAAETPLAVRLGGQILFSKIRCLQRVIPTGTNYAAGASAKCSLQFKATDPRRYGAVLSSATTAPPSTSGGITWPITWPITWGTGGSSTGTVNVVNSGDYPTPLMITIRGPLTMPAVYRQDTGAVLELNTVMVAGDVAVIDVLGDDVLMNGVSSKTLLSDRSAPVSSFLMPPGTTGIALRAAVTDPAASMAVAYYPAYL